MCGVVGFLGSPKASQSVLMGLRLLQHRGEDAAGIVSYDAEGFHVAKGLGLIDQVISPKDLESLRGTMAIGHVRYGTSGRSEISSTQPFLTNYPHGIAIVHNGNLVNFRPLTEEIQKTHRRHPLTQSDTEAILNLFAEQLALEMGPLSVDSIERAVKKVHEKAIGSYSIVCMIAGFGLVAFKDPLGIRPLVYGADFDKETKKPIHLFASESGVPTFLGFSQLKELKAGEMGVVTVDNHVTFRQVSPPQSRPCMFEWVYFASPQSEMDGSGVYQARINLGKNLAPRILREMAAGTLKPDVVVPVPETARIAAIALSEAIDVPYRELLIKNRYISRTFILDSQAKREHAVRLKIAPVISEIRGKNILLVDDSIVRGTTSRRLIELVREAGANEVYLASTAPPIRYPCFYGIDFPVQEELLAHGRNEDEIAVSLKADRVIYQSIEELQRAVTTAKSSGKPCMACLDGKYPTPLTGSEVFQKQRREDRIG